MNSLSSPSRDDCRLRQCSGMTPDLGTLERSMRTALMYVGLFVLLTAGLFPVRNTGEFSWPVLLATSAVGAALIVGLVAAASRAKEGSRLSRLTSRFLDDD